MAAADAAPILVYSERYGVLVRIPSRRKPSHVYSMAWVPVSGWVHADNSCPARRPCWHKEEAKKVMTNLTVVSGDHALVEQRPVLLVQYDARKISEGVDVELVANWAYNLGNTGGRGVSVRGAEEGTRQMAAQGEVLRVETCELVRDDEREAFFTATCRRYVINPETGQEIGLDQQTRGKRVPKYEMKADGSGEFFVKNWYEVGLVKAARNVTLAMMPGNVKTAMLRAGLDAKAQLNAGARPQAGARPEQGRPQQQQRPQQAAPQAQQPAGSQSAAPSEGANEEPGVADVPMDLATTRQTIEALLIRCKPPEGDWSQRDYDQLMVDMSQFTANGTGIFNPRSVPESKAAEALAFLRTKRGDA